MPGIVPTVTPEWSCRLRIQSLLCLKLYTFRKAEAMKLKKIIDSDTSKVSDKACLQYCLFASLCACLFVCL